jgi:glycine betaine catabolism B
MYFLLVLVAWTLLLSIVKIIPFDPISIAGTAFYLVAVCWIVNEILARIFKVGTNIESSIITGLILSLIVGPVNWIPSFEGMTKNLIFLTVVAAVAMVSKYILIYKGKHIFNPAAFGAVAAAIILNQGASWWVGMPAVMPVIILGGLLVIKKIRRWEIVLPFVLGYLLITSGMVMMRGGDPLGVIQGILLGSSLLFFAFVMLVEPLTSPPTKTFRIYFALVVLASAFILQTILPNVYYNLELSLLIGNIFTTLASPNFRQVFKLKKKQEIAPGVIEFQLEPFTKFNYKAGQYLEWTLPHKNPDNRGVRRDFTISSSPTEDFIQLTSKFYEKPSTFKQTLRALEIGDEIIGSRLGGEFTLPEVPEQKLVFIAGGIGVTPFRSMIKYLSDSRQERDVILIYSNKTQKDIVYSELFDRVKGVRPVYVLTDEKPNNWKGRLGFVDVKLIKEEVPDFKERLFYISGPEPMVEVFEKMIGEMGVAKSQIKRDYFPGYTDTHQK